MSDTISGLNSLYANTATSATRTDTTASTLQNTLSNSDLTSATDDELMDVCKDFEEYFVEQMVKSMMKMASVDSSDDDSYASIFGLSSETLSSDSAMSTMTGYYGDQMVSTLSEALCNDKGGTGLGLAQTLYQQMKRNYTTTDTVTSDTISGTDTAEAVEGDADNASDK